MSGVMLVSEIPMGRGWGQFESDHATVEGARKRAQSKVRGSMLDASAAEVEAACDRVASLEVGGSRVTVDGVRYRIVER